MGEDQRPTKPGHEAVLWLSPGTYKYYFLVDGQRRYNFVSVSAFSSPLDPLHHALCFEFKILVSLKLPRGDRSLKIVFVGSDFSQDLQDLSRLSYDHFLPTLPLRS